MRALLTFLFLCAIARSEIHFPENEVPGEVILAGRDRPVRLPHNVFVKECKSTADGKNHLLLLYRYRSDTSPDHDYFSLLLCSSSGEKDKPEWKVEFLMDAANMDERWKGDFRVIALGPLKSPDKAALMTSKLILEGNNRLGEFNWEIWNLPKSERIQVVAATMPFTPFPGPEE